MEFVGEREVPQTLAATSTTRSGKDTYYLIVGKTNDNSEDMSAKKCDVSWSQCRAGAARSTCLKSDVSWGQCRAGTARSTCPTFLFMCHGTCIQFGLIAHVTSLFSGGGGNAYSRTQCCSKSDVEILIFLSAQMLSSMMVLSQT